MPAFHRCRRSPRRGCAAPPWPARRPSYAGRRARCGRSDEHDAAPPASSSRDHLLRREKRPERVHPPRRPRTHPRSTSSIVPQTPSLRCRPSPRDRRGRSGSRRTRARPRPRRRRRRRTPSPTGAPPPGAGVSSVPRARSATRKPSSENLRASAAPFPGPATDDDTYGLRCSAMSKMCVLQRRVRKRSSPASCRTVRRSRSREPPDWAARPGAAGCAPMFDQAHESRPLGHALKPPFG